MSAHELAGAVERFEVAAEGGSHDAEHDAALNLAAAAMRMVGQVAELVVGAEEQWTVFGVWEAGQPIPVVVVQGHHEGSGGDVEAFPEGFWAGQVTAADALAAQAAGVRRASERMPPRLVTDAGAGRV